MNWFAIAARCVLAALVGAVIGFFLLTALVGGLILISWGQV